MSRVRIAVGLAVAALMAGCATGQGPESQPEQTSSESAASPLPSPSPTSAVSEEELVAASEAFIDAFYSFDAAPLEEMLAGAEGSAPMILGYQAWAEGAHYKVLERHGCTAVAADRVECPVTVEDDLLLALGSDFKVTDQFDLYFRASEIVSVQTSSNDPEIVGQAFGWVFNEYPELLEGPCQGFDQGAPDTGDDCARAVVAGFEEFAASEDFPGP